MKWSLVIPGTITYTGVWKQNWVRNDPLCRAGPGILPTFICLRKGERKEGEGLQARQSSACLCLWDSTPKTFIQLLSCRELAGLLTMPASLQHPPRDQGMHQPPSSIPPGPRRSLWGVTSSCATTVWSNLSIWFSRNCGVGWMVGLNDFRGLVQPMTLWFYELTQMAGYTSQGHDIFGQAGAWCVPHTVGRASVTGQDELLPQLAPSN